MLELCLAEAHGAETRVVVLDGEPGIGKSTLLSRFIASVPDAAVLRATGDEAESLVSYGVVEQLLAHLEDDSRARRRALRNVVGDHDDPAASGNNLVDTFQRARRGREVVIVAIDDLHWTDRPSAIALRLALRRARQIPLLALFALRSEQSLRLGEDWARFVSGDHRVVRLRIGGLGRRDVVALADALGAGQLTPWAASRLLEHTGGNPLHCCALLEELDPDVWTRPGRLPAPRALAGLVLARLGKLSTNTQRLVSGAAVLGRRCLLDTAAAVAGLTDPLSALQEAVEAGLLAEIVEGPAAEISFAHALIQRAVYDDLGPARRREIHSSAVVLVAPLDALSHRVAAAYGPDDALAATLRRRPSGLAGRGISPRPRHGGGTRPPRARRRRSGADARSRRSSCWSAAGTWPRPTHCWRAPASCRGIHGWIASPRSSTCSRAGSTSACSGFRPPGWLATSRSRCSVPAWRCCWPTAACSRTTWTEPSSGPSARPR